MALRITCRNKLELEPKFRAIVEKKLGRLDRTIEKLQSIDVIFSEEKPRHTAEVLIHAGSFSASACVEESDLGKAFDGALNRVKKQLSKQRDRKQNKRPRPAKE